MIMKENGLKLLSGFYFSINKFWMYLKYNEIVNEPFLIFNIGDIRALHLSSRTG